MGTPLVTKIDDLLNKKTKSLKYDANEKYKKIVSEQESKKNEELMSTIKQFRENVLDSGRNMRFIFEKMDLDGNGILSPDEIKAAFILLGIGKSLFLTQLYITHYRW